MTISRIMLWVAWAALLSALVPMVVEPRHLPAIALMAAWAGSAGPAYWAARARPRVVVGGLSLAALGALLALMVPEGREAILGGCTPMGPVVATAGLPATIGAALGLRAAKWRSP